MIMISFKQSSEKDLKDSARDLITQLDVLDRSYFGKDR